MCGLSGSDWGSVSSSGWVRIQLGLVSLEEEGRTQDSTEGRPGDTEIEDDHVRVERDP